MADNHTEIQSISPDAAEQLARKNHALDGTLFLTSTSNYGDGAGIAPTGNYAGFLCGDIVPTITAMTFNTNKHSFAPGEDATDFVLTSGGFYPLDGIKTVTITAGTMWLIKQGTY